MGRRGPSRPHPKGHGIPGQVLIRITCVPKGHLHLQGFSCKLPSRESWPLIPTTSNALPTSVLNLEVGDKPGRRLGVAN